MCCGFTAGPEIDGASGCLHSCMHAAGSGYHGSCVHRMLYCSAVQSGVDGFAPVWPKAELKHPLGSTWCMIHSVSEWNADKTRVDKVRYWTTSRTPVPQNRFVHGSMEFYGGGWIWS
jgi:hypothetical protein